MPAQPEEIKMNNSLPNNFFVVSFFEQDTKVCRGCVINVAGGKELQPGVYF